MMPLLVPIAISLLIGSYATADGLCGKPCWAVLRNANSSFCSFCRSAEGCWPFPRINFNIVARWCYFWSSVARLALFWVFVSICFLILTISLTCTFNNTKFHSDLSFLFYVGYNSSSKLRAVFFAVAMDWCCVMIQDLSVPVLSLCFVFSFCCARSSLLDHFWTPGRVLAFFLELQLTTLSFRGARDHWSVLHQIGCGQFRFRHSDGSSNSVDDDADAPKWISLSWNRTKSFESGSAQNSIVPGCGTVWWNTDDLTGNPRSSQNRMYKTTRFFFDDCLHKAR